SGTFTVVGNHMRIDCHVIAVERRSVVLTDFYEGEKAAFFELEKTLVRKLIDTIGVKLAPAERTAVARIHTADFDAFRLFSNGVAAFDNKQYDEAFRALQEASRLDSNFTLSLQTLADYQQLASSLSKQTEAMEKLEELKKQAAIDTANQE